MESGPQGSELFSPVEFEELAEINGDKLWSAEELCRILSYASYQTFQMGPISKAMRACMAAGIPTGENFHIDQGLRLTRFACYLVAMNADPRKPEVAKAQAYFAAIAEEVAALGDAADVERVYVRSEVSERVKGLGAAAKSHGVQNYPLFVNAGYRGMYNMDVNKLRSLKHTPPKRSPLDFMAPRELAANLFRIQETEAKIQHDNVRGQRRLEQTAGHVGSQVRHIMHENSGQYPEELEPADDIKRSHKRLKAANKGFKQLDIEAGS